MGDRYKDNSRFSTFLNHVVAFQYFFQYIKSPRIILCKDYMQKQTLLISL